MLELYLEKVVAKHLIVFGIIESYSHFTVRELFDLKTAVPLALYKLLAPALC